MQLCSSVGFFSLQKAVHKSCISLEQVTSDKQVVSDNNSPIAKREAGVLLHVSSLPGEFGIGDMGPAARKFIDFLAEAGHSIWQVLPLTVTSEGAGYSPYSAWSAFAGNPMFIDPWQLVDMGLAERRMVKKQRIKTRNRVRYRQASGIRLELLDRAFLHYTRHPQQSLQQAFSIFKEREKYWLDDFAIFGLLAEKFHHRPWHTWPSAYRDRNPDALAEFAATHRDALEKTRFTQFLFSAQWNGLREYAGEKGVKIFGDIPVYIDYQSADAWAHPELFKLNSEKTLQAVAGVPPDYFNQDGQLWGMPVFNWKVMQKNGFDWWIRRIRKNLEWFDLLRLDHFRGFSAYWEIPAKAETAAAGRWVPGPGKKLFEAIRKNFPSMPFVAEDLGMIDQPVYELRDQYGLPGMAVLQFGFGEDAETSIHHPENMRESFIAYTGTHDNNTLKGWYRHETDLPARKRIRHYVAKKRLAKGLFKSLIFTVFASTARLAVIPLQDWLELDEKSRMNMPSSAQGNWKWKIRKRNLRKKLAKRMSETAKHTGRMSEHHK